MEELPATLFSVRLVSADYYMSKPKPILDITKNNFRKSRPQRVPTIRVFGSTPCGQTCCLHIHRVFPYLLIPYDGSRPVHQYLENLANSIDKELNKYSYSSAHQDSNVTDSGQTSRERVYKLCLVSGTPFYGYYTKEEVFIKVYLFEPTDVSKLADILLKGSVLNKIFQPYEAHIPFLLQFSIDYNIHGMNYINLSNVRFRHDVEYKTVNHPTRMEMIRNNDALSKENLDQSVNSQFEQSFMSVSKPDKIAVVCQKYFKATEYPNNVCMNTTVFPRQSSCALEVDALSEEIINRLEVNQPDQEGNQDFNPGIKFLWRDLNKRRMSAGLEPTSFQSTVKDTTQRWNYTDSEKLFHELMWKKFNEYRKFVQQSNLQDEKNKVQLEVQEQNEEDTSDQTYIGIDTETLNNKDIAEKLELLSAGLVDCHPSQQPEDQDEQDEEDELDQFNLSVAVNKVSDIDNFTMHDETQNMFQNSSDFIDKRHQDGTIGDVLDELMADEGDSSFLHQSQAFLILNDEQDEEHEEYSKPCSDGNIEESNIMEDVTNSDDTLVGVELNFSTPTTSPHHTKKNELSTSQEKGSKGSNSPAMESDAAILFQNDKDEKKSSEEYLLHEILLASQGTPKTSCASQSLCMQGTADENEKVEQYPVPDRDITKAHCSKQLEELIDTPKDEESPNVQPFETIAKDNINQFEQKILDIVKLSKDGRIQKNCKNLQSSSITEILEKRAFEQNCKVFFSDVRDLADSLILEPKACLELDDIEVCQDEDDKNTSNSFDNQSSILNLRNQISELIQKISVKGSANLSDIDPVLKLTLRNKHFMDDFKFKLFRTEQEYDILQKFLQTSSKPQSSNSTMSSPRSFNQSSIINSSDDTLTKFIKQCRKVKVESENLIYMTLEVFSCNYNNFKQYQGGLGYDSYYWYPSADTDEVYACVYTVHSDDAKNQQNYHTNVIILAPSRPTATTDQMDQMKQQNTAVKILENVIRARNPVVSQINIQLVNKEMDIFEEIEKQVLKADPDLLIGYDVQGDSWGYLIQRAAVLHVDLQHRLSRINLKEKWNPFAARTNFNQSNADGKNGGVNMREDALNKKSEQVVNYYARKQNEWQVPGRVIINLWKIFRGALSLHNYTFEKVVKHLLKKTIPKYSYTSMVTWFFGRNNAESQHQFVGGGKEKVIDYFVKRSILMLQLIDNVDFVRQTCEQARLYGIQFYEVLTRGSQFRVESMMIRLARPRNLVSVTPSRYQLHEMRAPEALPLILEPETKLYTDPLLVLDFQSLYPSMIIAYNMCFSTCLGNLRYFQYSKNVSSAGNRMIKFKFGCTEMHKKFDELVRIYQNRQSDRLYSSLDIRAMQQDEEFQKLQLQNYFNIMPNGVVFVRPEVRRGILPQMLDEILSTRITIKNELKRAKAEDNQIIVKMMDARQLALKLIANVTFGYTSANFSGRMPCVEIGDSIIEKAKETLERAINMVEAEKKWGARVVYGDTDSLFVLLTGRSRLEAFAIGNDIVRQVSNDNPQPVKLKFEKVYMPSILQTKKRYCGMMFETPEQEKGVVESKGIETIRRDNCLLVQEIMQKCLEMLFNEHGCDLSQLKRYVQDQFMMILQNDHPYDKYIFAKQYRGEGYYKPKAKVPANEIAKKLKRTYGRALEPKIGSRVQYIIRNGNPNATLISLTVTPNEFAARRDYQINAHYYGVRYVAQILNRLLVVLGLDVKKWWHATYKEYKRLPTRYIATSSFENRHLFDVLRNVFYNCQGQLGKGNQENGSSMFEKYGDLIRQCWLVYNQMQNEYIRRWNYCMACTDQHSQSQSTVQDIEEVNCAHQCYNFDCQNIYEMIKIWRLLESSSLKMHGALAKCVQQQELNIEDCYSDDGDLKQICSNIGKGPLCGSENITGMQCMKQHQQVSVNAANRRKPQTLHDFFSRQIEKGKAWMAEETEMHNQPVENPAQDFDTPKGYSHQQIPMEKLLNLSSSQVDRYIETVKQNDFMAQRQKDLPQTKDVLNLTLDDFGRSRHQVIISKNEQPTLSPFVVNKPINIDDTMITMVSPQPKPCLQLPPEPQKNISTATISPFLARKKLKFQNSQSQQHDDDEIQIVAQHITTVPKKESNVPAAKKAYPPPPNNSKTTTNKIRKTKSVQQSKISKYKNNTTGQEIMRRRNKQPLQISLSPFVAKGANLAKQKDDDDTEDDDEEIIFIEQKKE